LTLACESATDELAEFIKSQVFDKFKRKGAVVGLSGGIDSSVTAALSVKALGRERVMGVILPERESSPKSERYSVLLAQQLGIQYERVDLTPVLESLACYEKKEKVIKASFPEYNSTYKYKLILPQNLLDKDRINFYTLIIEDPQGNRKSKRLSPKEFFEIMAANDMKQRCRMLMLYYFAEKNNYIVAGTTNRSEMVQGFFVKYGDGGVDIEPIAHLYKAQVIALAAYLGLPDEIIKRTPSPDTYSLEVSDEEFYFCLPYDRLDLLLYAWEHNIPMHEVTSELNLTEQQVARAFKDFDIKRQATWHLTQLPVAPVQ